MAWVLGVGVTFAEPAVGALQTLGALVHCEQAPYLYFILNEWTSLLVISIGCGVGLSVMVGMMRLLYGWAIKPVIYASVTITVGLTILVWLFSGVAEVIGLAWDCGAVTTGPVTVPVVIALGIGLASSSDREGSELDGFGIVTLASLYPVITVLLLALCLNAAKTREEIILGVCTSVAQSDISIDAALEVENPNAAWYEKSPYNEIVLGVRAVVPLIAFLLAVNNYIQKEELAKSNSNSIGTEAIELGSFRDASGGDGYTKVQVMSPTVSVDNSPAIVAVGEPQTTEMIATEVQDEEEESTSRYRIGTGSVDSNTETSLLSVSPRSNAPVEGLEDSSNDKKTELGDEINMQPPPTAGEF